MCSMIHQSERDPSDHEAKAVASLARTVRRGRSELTMLAIGELSLFLGFLAPIEHMVAYVQLSKYNKIFRKSLRTWGKV